MHQRRIIIDICGGFTLENTPLASHSFPLPQDGERVEETRLMDHINDSSVGKAIAAHLSQAK